MPRSLSRGVAALLLSCALLLTTAACGSDTTQSLSTGAVASPSASSTFEQQKLAKTRFVANAGLAAGAAYQWIVKPYRAGKFKKGADGRTFALVKAGLAGAFTYNRLKAAVNNAKGDPLLSKAVAPLSAGIESLKELGIKLRKGEVDAADVGGLEGVVNGIKDAGRSAGAEVVDKVPSASQLSGG
ncbi:hypothetical protein [Streptomyces sp. NRRL F-5727]|uniref:hypothetical protein n=1 Tax=Streptomyces sp. NRRL F-5727 TaxID=1463871 RepID=UPI0004CC493C|nr:hypothetical protein [Streptomyces sp. NRRL F-5727]